VAQAPDVRRNRGFLIFGELRPARRRHWATILFRLLDTLGDWLFAFAIIRHSHPNTAQLIETYELHRRLLNAFVQRDAAYARQLMELTMERAWLDDAQLPADDGL
jgi:DNA-binding GntR family transcriptional regulator